MYKRNDKYLWILILICFISLILFLGCSYFNTRGEPREAIVSLSMLKYGNWTLPVNSGTDIAYKPPLLHWCIALLSSITGQVTPFTSRLPSALSLIAMIIAGYAFYSKRISAKTAFMAGLVTLTCFEVHRAGTLCRVDMLLCSLTVIALYQLHKWGERDMRGFPFIAVLCMSGAFLTKGPIGIILPCLVEFVYLWIRGKKLIRLICTFALLAISACAIPAIWYVAAYRQGGDHFLQLVYEENVLRFLGKMSYSSHEKPVYYNFITVIAGYTPYTLLVLLSLFSLKYTVKRYSAGDLWARLKAYIRRMDDTRLFSMLSIILIFVFYCIPKSKRSVYLLPIYPFIAFFLAEYIIYLAKNHRAVLKTFGNIMASLSILLSACFVCVRAGLIPETMFSGKHAASTIKMMEALANEPLGIMQITVLVLPIIASTVFWTIQKRNSQTLIYSMFGIILSIFISLDGFYQPVVLSSKSDRNVAMKIKEIVPEGRIYSYRTDIIEGDRMHPFTINFYLGDRVVPFDCFLPDRGYLIAGNNDIDTFKETYTAYNVEEVYDFNHRSCDDKKMLHLYRFDKTGK